MGLDAYATGSNLSKIGTVTKVVNLLAGIAIIAFAIIVKAYVHIATGVIVGMSGFPIAELLDGFAILVYDIDCMKKWQQEDREATKSN